MTILSDRKLNLAVAKLAGRDEADCSLLFDPARSIKDAMGLLSQLPPGWDFWITSVGVFLFGGVDDGASKKYTKHDELPRAISAAYVAAWKVAKP